MLYNFKYPQSIMNWDWEKLQEQKQRRTGMGGPSGPNFDEFGEKFKNFKGFRFPVKLVALFAVVGWLLTGIYTVQPQEEALVLLFGEFNRVTGPGPHYHLPYPVEDVLKVRVTTIRQVDVGIRTGGTLDRIRGVEGRAVPHESRMLTGDENIVDLPFSVQYFVKDSASYAFNVRDPQETVKAAAEAAMREVMGRTKIDFILTAGKEAISAECRQVLQDILDSYKTGIMVKEVVLSDPKAPSEVIDAFKDVASAREDRSRFINEAEAYRNEILPQARGQAAQITNAAQAYKESVVRKAEGEASRFLSVLKEYNRAPEVTRERLYIETMERILSNPDLEKIIIGEETAKGVVPYLPLDRMQGGEKK